MAYKAIDPISGSDWDAVKARHLLNRAGFGGTREQIAAFASLSPEAAVDKLVDLESTPCTLPGPDCVLPPLNRRDLRDAAKELSEDERQRLYNDLQRDERNAVQQLKAWWVERMYTTPRPLEEKLTLFWHGHFATSSQKVRSSYHTYFLNQVFRENAAGNFKQLTTKVGQSPSMLLYLDNVRSNKTHPNENWARELMELFTLGQGNYTENDIKESAKAFTGWTINNDIFAYNERIHDEGVKTFMGRSGNFDGWDILDIIFEQPACAEFICRKLAMYFVTESPDEKFVRSLADTFRQHQYEIKPVLRQMFLSREFYRDDNMATQIKSPAQYVVQLARDLGIENPPYPEMARACQQLGQDLFYPQNVKGWDGNRAWINANTLLLRYNLAKSLLAAKPSQKTPAEDMEMMTMAEAGETMKAEAASGKVQASKPWSPKAFFASLQFSTYDECVHALSSTIFAMPISDQQRAVLKDALASGDTAAPVTVDDLDSDRMVAALHLALSMAEYQLC